MYGKVAIIAGSTRGIGLATAKLLAQSGASVVVTGRTLASCEMARDIIIASGYDAMAFQAHIKRPEECEALVNAVIDHYGRLDIIVANAAINPTFATLDSLSPDLWRKIFATNVDGPLAIAQSGLPKIAATGGGAMVMVSSINAFFASPGAGAYGISKAALNQMTRQLALEWGGRGIRVNAIAPGTTKTDMIRRLAEQPGWIDRIIERTPLGRIASPEDVAAAIRFMASDDSRHITGQILTVDGGETIARL